MPQRAVYYARVSTEEERQINALQKQCADLKECISANHWIFVESYVDEGRTGTVAKKRDEYNRLVEDLETDKFDIIVIKSQDRLMRNEKDWYIFIDRLVTNGKRLFFYMENTFYTPDNSLITGIKAILAAEYSRDLSRKLNNAHKRRERLGSTVMTNGTMIGYDQNNGEIYINEKEAEIVRKVFNMYLQGDGTLTISKKLAEQGILNNKGNPYGESTLIRMLKNEKYMGTMICNKYHKDFNTKKIIANDQSQWYIHENRVPAIISKETFEKAQKIRMSRQAKNADGRKRGKHTPKHILSGKIICGECGSPMNIYNVKNGSGNVKRRIICSNFSRFGRVGVGIYKNQGCNMPNGSLAKLEEIINNIIKMIKIDENYFIKSLESSQGYDNNDNLKEQCKKIEKKITEIKRKRTILLDKFLEGVIQEDMYTIKEKQFANEEQELEVEKNSIKEKISEENLQDKKMEYLIKQIRNQEIKYETFLEMIDKILMYKDCLYLYIIGIDTPFLVNESLGYGRKHTAENWK